MTERRGDIIDRMAFAEQEAVRELGERIGYGRIIQLCERLWGEMLPGGLSPAMHARNRLIYFDEREPLVQKWMADCDWIDVPFENQTQRDYVMDMKASAAAVRDFKLDTTPTTPPVDPDVGAHHSGT